MSILSAPFYAVFNLDLYRRILREPLSKGLLYLAYLSFLSSLGVFLFLDVHIKPKATDLLQWAQSEMPPIVWSPEGIRLQTEENVYQMFHPEYGYLVTFDLEKTRPTAEDMKASFLFITASDIFYQTGRGGAFDSYSLLMPPGQNYEGPAAISIGPEFLDRVYDTLKPWVYVVSFLLSYVLFFAGKFLLAVCLAPIGLMMNQMRSEAIPFGTILTVTIFAMTTSTLLEIAGMIFPWISFLSINLLTHVGLTALYLIMALKFTDAPMSSGT